MTTTNDKLAEILAQTVLAVPLLCEEHEVGFAARKLYQQDVVMHIREVVKALDLTGVIALLTAEGQQPLITTMVKMREHAAQLQSMVGEAIATIATQELDLNRADEALAFYANPAHYLTSGWQGDQDPAEVASDAGARARAALEPAAKS